MGGDDVSIYVVVGAVRGPVFVRGWVLWGDGRWEPARVRDREFRVWDRVGGMGDICGRGKGTSG